MLVLSFRLFDNLRVRGLTPKVSSYNATISAAAEHGEFIHLRQEVQGGAAAVATATHELIVDMKTKSSRTRSRCYDLEEVLSILTDNAARTPRR